MGKLIITIIGIVLMGAFPAIGIPLYLLFLAMGWTKFDL